MGKLVVIEGLDGSGKSTQLKLLSAALKERGIPSRSISFPDYSNPSSTLVKMYLSGEFGGSAADVNAYSASLFYTVDRVASFKRYWKEDYDSGKIIVAGRYTTSNAVHQASKLPREQWGDYIDWLEDLEYNKTEMPRPDCVIFLDMPQDISQRLLTGRYRGDENKKDIHERDRAYLDRCREAAIFAAERCGWKIVNCAENGLPRTIDDIAGDVLKTVLNAIE